LETPNLKLTFFHPGNQLEIEKKNYKMEFKKKKMISMAADETFDQLYEDQLELDRKKILIYLVNENKFFFSK
jgi:hypothetical protein